MGSVDISESGIVFCGSRFADLRRCAPPTTVRYIRHDISTKSWNESHPTILAFSPPRTQGNYHSSHPGICAVSYKEETGPFFAVGVMRCDTWAIQWVIERTGCLAAAEINHLAPLSSALVCGTYLAKDGKTGFFVASREDVTRVSKSENRTWRSFSAPPKKLNVSFPANTVALMKALSPSVFLVLLKDGTLQTVSVQQADDETGTWGVKEVVVGKRGEFKEFIPSPSGNVVIASSPDSKERQCLLVYNSSRGFLDVLQVGDAERSFAAVTRTRVELLKNLRIRHASFAGPFHVAVVQDDNSLLFVSLVPEGSGAFSTSSSAAFRVHAPVLATWFDSSSESHVVLCAQGENTETSRGLESLFSLSCPFGNGPYTSAELHAAEISYVTSFSHLRGAGDSTISAAEEMKYFLSSAFHSEKVDNLAPLKLHYVLASTNNEEDDVASAVFSVETAPHVHTRLTQQWHNASTGLRVLLADESCPSSICLQWNPRHLRRALRLMSSGQLTATFHRAANCMRAQGEGLPGAFFNECATATVSLALQIVTLSRQAGCVLDQSGVEVVAALLRAARASGHSTAKYANRMELLLETCLQQRLVNRLLQGKAEGEGDKGEPTFFGVAHDMRSERQLQTRYNASAWADGLSTGEATHAKVAAAANKYLAVATTDNVPVTDWTSLGTHRSADALLNEFESTLVTLTN